MGAKYVESGCAIDFTPAADVALGEVLIQGDLLGVAMREIKAGELGVLVVEGVFDLPKASGAGTQIVAGSRVFWNEATKLATPADGGGANKLAGKSVALAGDNDITVRVRLSQ